MRLKIDIGKSIEKRRLIPSSWYFKILDYFNISFFAIVFIICIIGPTIGVEITIDSTDFFFITSVLAIFIFGVHALYKMDRLSVVENYQSKLDKNFFMLIANENEWSLINQSANILIFNTTHWFLHERQVTIIINTKFIFINVMSFGAHDIKSPFYMRKDRVILSQIIERIKNNAT